RGHVRAHPRPARDLGAATDLGAGVSGAASVGHAGRAPRWWAHERDDHDSCCGAGVIAAAGVSLLIGAAVVAARDGLSPLQAAVPVLLVDMAAILAALAAAVTGLGV